MACMLARPFLNVSKAQLIATLEKAKIGFADDPTNRDMSFTRPRLRALMPALAAEGGDAAAWRGWPRGSPGPMPRSKCWPMAPSAISRSRAANPRKPGFDAKAFAAMPEEIRLRLLLRAIDRFGHEGPAELGKVEALLAALDRAAMAKTAAATAETDAGGCAGQPDRGPDPRRAGAAPAPPGPLKGPELPAFHRAWSLGYSLGRVLTTPGRPRIHRHYLSGNRARMG